MRSWETLILVVQSILSHTKLARLDNQCHLTLFMGLVVTDPISSITGTFKEPMELKNVSDVRAAQLLGVAKTHDYIGEYSQ